MLFSYRKNVPDFTTTRQKKDLAIINNLAVKVDLDTVFNWNVKEVFMYLIAEYKSDTNVSRVLVIISCIRAASCHLPYTSFNS